MEGMELGIAPLPSGPVGTPISMFNGLGDSISAQSDNKEEAARLVAFLGSDEAQQIIGERAPFFPSTDAGTEAAIESYAAEGLDVTPFTDRVKNGETGLYPLVENSASDHARPCSRRSTSAGCARSTGPTSPHTTTG